LQAAFESYCAENRSGIFFLTRDSEKWQYNHIYEYPPSRKILQRQKNVPCPLTEQLILAGYQQTSGGYIDLAKKQG
jgi:hypothetical protein